MGEAPLAALEQAMSEVVRNGNLMRLHEQLTADAGIQLERAATGVMAALADAPGARLSDLAHRLGIDVSTASRQVQALEAQGLVRRVAHPSDRRATTLELTDEGADALARIRAARRRLLADALAGWDSDDVETLARLLGRLGAELVRELAARTA